MIKFLIFFLLWCGIASADVVVIYNDQTKDVYSISDRNDAVVPEGYSVGSLPGRAEDYPNPQDYQFVSKRLKINTAKIKDRNEAADAALERLKELDAVNKRAMKQAYEQLKAEGYQFKVLTNTEFGG